jgi:hypothetical protein
MENVPEKVVRVDYEGWKAESSCKGGNHHQKSSLQKRKKLA